jgi:hypothetical protein
MNSIELVESVLVWALSVRIMTIFFRNLERVFTYVVQNTALSRCPERFHAGARRYCLVEKR